MGRIIKLKILGEPKAKQSVKMANRKDKTGNAFIHKYQPRKVVEHERNLSFDIKSQIPAGFIPFEGPVRINKLFYIFAPIKSLKKFQHEAINGGKIVYKQSRPDLSDNLNKSVFDCMTGIVYKDDSQIVSMNNVKKFYGVVPRIEIELEELSLS